MLSFQGVRQPEAGCAARRFEALHQPLLAKERTGAPQCRGGRCAAGESRARRQGLARKAPAEDVGPVTLPTCKSWGEPYFEIIFDPRF